MERSLNTPLSKVNYNIIDLMKFIMAVCVLVIHRPIFTSETANSVFRLSICWISVPFFFISTGFFFGKSMMRDSSPKSFFKSFKRIFLLYLIWTIIYFPIIYYAKYIGSFPVVDVKHIVGFAAVFVKDFLIKTSFVHFWYLLSVVWAMPIIYLLTKKIKPLVLTAVSAVIAVVFNFASVYGNDYPLIGNIYNAIPLAFQNVFSIGLTSVLIGYCFAQKEDRKSSGKFMQCAALIILVAADIALVIINSKDGKIFNVIHKPYTMAAAALLFSVLLDVKVKNTKVCKELRKYSTIIYCSHLMLFTDWIKDFFAFLGFNFGSFEPFAIFAVTCIYSFAISAIIINLAKIPKLKFLRYLY